MPTVKVGDINMYYEVHGKGEPLLMMAGMGLDRQGGIITSSRFTSGAGQFRLSARVRPLLRDGEWLRKTLGRYVPCVL